MTHLILLEFMNKINIELLGRDHTEPVPISGYTMVNEQETFVIVNLNLTKAIYVYDNGVFYLVDLKTKECMKTKLNIEIIDIYLFPFERLPNIHKFVPFLEIEYNSFPIEIKKWFKNDISLQQVLDSVPNNTRNFINEFGSFESY
jgi:hypothetical protein